jgi:hypothetical protein
MKRKMGFWAASFMPPIGTLLMKQIIDNQMVIIMKGLLFFLLILSFLRCDEYTTNSLSKQSTILIDTTDLAVTLVRDTFYAHGVQLINRQQYPILIKKIVFSGVEFSYEPNCEVVPYSECQSDYCYLPKQNSSSRKQVFANALQLTHPLCTVYYQVHRQLKMTVADSVEVLPCKIGSKPGVPHLDGKLYCYWLNGCND